MPLDEKALRRPEFTEGHKVRLGDGQEWTFPKPVLRWFPAPSEGGFRPKRSPAYGRDFQAGVDRLIDSSDQSEEAENERHELRLCLSAELLCRNYDLDEAALEVLLPLEVAEGNAEMWRDVYYVLLGIGAPKR